MCVRCGTGAIAWCTDPTRHGEVGWQAADDLHARWLPSDSSIRHARALLAAEERATHALIPMLQPGKQWGFWSTGQVVMTVPGVVFLAVNQFMSDDAEVPGFATARRLAGDCARAALGRSAGTVAFAVVSQDEAVPVAVFEDFGQMPADDAEVQAADSFAARTRDAIHDLVSGESPGTPDANSRWAEVARHIAFSVAMHAPDGLGSFEDMSALVEGVLQSIVIAC